MDSLITDQSYLLDDQYKDGTNLNARARLHIRYSVNKRGWFRWVFDQMELPAIARILELGSGPGLLWANVAPHVPPGWQITLSDFSPGMLEEARRSLSRAGNPFAFERIDAQAIPFPDNTFDAVIANHMLYHVPDRDKALAEINRVLKPGSPFYAATNGVSHMRELYELIARFIPDSDTTLHDFSAGVFGLENGFEQLSGRFPNVMVRRYPDALMITDAEPLLDYILSGAAALLLDDTRKAELKQFIEQEIAAVGAFRITKESGLFIAWSD